MPFVRNILSAVAIRPAATDNLFEAIEEDPAEDVAEDPDGVFADIDPPFTASQGLSPAALRSEANL